MTDLSTLPDRALSIMQPWAWLIVKGYKDIENRDWRTNYRGPVAIHAGKKVDRDAAQDVAACRHPVTGGSLVLGLSSETSNAWRGGIVGVAEIVDCVSASPSEWFVGRFGFIVRNARPVEFIPCKGALSFFEWKGRLL
ncbi:MAG: ASCH domain-containing protein [Mesorhizobium sp.]|nr:MAG: ASCH domain-containing protein [Mesorhizobium sp.]